MNLKYGLGFCAVLISVYGFAQRSPRLGLTLSGGGAKGLAHIGILKAIDRAGLKVDYITGTSMGSIMGALYAAGYSGHQIEQIGREIDWNLLLSTRDQRSEVSPNEKYEFENYAVELPIENKAFKISTGIPGQ